MVLAEHLIGLQIKGLQIKGCFNFKIIQKIKMVLSLSHPFLRQKWGILRIRTLSDLVTSLNAKTYA